MIAIEHDTLTGANDGKGQLDVYLLNEISKTTKYILTLALVPFDTFFT